MYGAGNPLYGPDGTALNSSGGIMARPGMLPNGSGRGVPAMAGGYGTMVMTGPNMGGMTGLDPGMMSVPQIWQSITTGIAVKQKMDPVEVITGCDTPNRYYVYEKNQGGDARRKVIFKCKEQSGWCARNCMSANCRPFNMEIKKCFRDDDYDNGETVIHMTRECKCTCLCCNRPEVKIFLTEGGQQVYLGKVVDPWDCCNHSYKVYDAADQLRFYIEAGCCQLGFCCGCPCDSCEKIIFDVWAGNKERPLAPIVKIGQGCLKNAVSSADSFFTEFATDFTWQDKTLMLGAILMIDFMQFEEKGGNRNKGDRAGYGVLDN